MDDFRIHRPALLSASVSYLANASLSSTFFNSSTAATLLRRPVPQLIICESRPPAPIQAGALWSIEDRGKWLGFHRRAALPFGSASKFCGGGGEWQARYEWEFSAQAGREKLMSPPTAGCPGVEITALRNRTKTRAEALARKLGYADLRVYGDWQSLIGAGTCDVISIATAPTLRSDPLLAALDQGCHVLVEKPISVGVPEARVMAAAAEAANTVTASCFNWRYAPAYQAARNPSAQARSALYAASSILTKGRLTRRSNSGA